VVPFGVPLLWAEPREGGPAVEVRLWPRRRGPRLPKQPNPAAANPAPPPPDPDAPSEGDETPPPEPPRNVRQFPPGKRPGGRPPAQNRPQRQRRPPAAS